MLGVLFKVWQSCCHTWNKSECSYLIFWVVTQKILAIAQPKYSAGLSEQLHLKSHTLWCENIAKRMQWENLKSTERHVVLPNGTPVLQIRPAESEIKEMAKEEISAWLGSIVLVGKEHFRGSLDLV